MTWQLIYKQMSNFGGNWCLGRDRGTVSGGAEVGPTLVSVPEERALQVLLAVTHVVRWGGIGAPPHRVPSLTSPHLCPRERGTLCWSGMGRPSL